MSRNRIIYQSEGLFVGPTGALASGQSLVQIERVRSVNHTATINRTDVNEFGKLGYIDRVILTPPEVTLTFEALLVDAHNSKTMGLITDGSVSCIGNILSGVNDPQSYYIALAKEGSDLIGGTGAGCFAFGNGFLADIRYQGQVGQFATESYTVNALNYEVFTESTGNVPTIDQKTGLPVVGPQFVIPVATTGFGNSVSALRPGDITLTLTDTFGFDSTNVHIQNFNLNVPLTRENVFQLGNRFAYAKFITFPVTVTMTCAAIAGEIARSNLADRICSDPFIDLVVNLQQPSCSGNGLTAIQFTMKSAKLNSTNYSSQIGSNATVDFNWSTQIGGTADTTIGLFVSGIF